MHWKSAKSLIMGQRHHSKPERILLMKIDWFILSYCCLMYFTNYLDRSNINNAYVSGMKEDLNMLGNQFNKINTIFTCGYIIGMIPNNLMLQLVSPRIWFPCMQLTWAVLTFCTSVVKNVEQIYVIRFFQAIAESSTFVGAHYILGSWYNPRELGKRTGIFTSSGLVGTLFSGILQGVVYRNLNGVGGRSGWRWLFIIDGIITLPIAFYGFLVFPDLPQTTRAFYLSEEERILAYERLDEKPEHGHGKHAFSWAAVKRVFTSWRWYACTLLFGISGETECIGSNNIMGQWMKAIGGFTVEQIDFYPSGLTSVAIASTLICATLTDRTQVRWPVLVYMAVACTISAICLLVWQAPTGLKFFAFYLSGASYAGQATTFAWANQICSNDDFERSIVLASMNVCNGAINAWWSLLFYPATDAPRFRKGMIAMICVCAATLGITWVVYALEKREWRRGSDLKRNSGDRKSEEDGSRIEKREWRRGSDLKRNSGDRKSEEDGSRIEKAEGDHLEKEREETNGQSS